MITETAPTIVGAGTFEVLFMDECWHDRYSILQRERFSDLDSAIAAAFQTVQDDRENEEHSYDCIRIWNRQTDTVEAEWVYCCDDAEPDGEGGMIGIGYDWHRIC